jgi:hypothetical protein
LHPRYLGPYEVARKTARGSYILKELDGALHQQRYAAFRLILYIRRDDPILWEPCDDGEEELDDPDLDAGVGSEDRQAVMDISDQDPEILDSGADTDLGSDTSLSCLALISDPATNEASTTESSKAKLNECYITKMQPTDIIHEVRPEALAWTLAQVGGSATQTPSLDQGSYRIWLYSTDPINTISFLAIIKGPNDIRSISDRSDSETGDLLNAGFRHAITHLYELRVAAWINIADGNHLCYNKGIAHPTQRLIQDLSGIELTRII